MTKPAGPSPGWYSDPQSRERLRFWDGEGWTEQHRARQDLDGGRGETSPSRSSSPSTRGWIVTIAAALLLIVIVGVVVTSHHRSPSGADHVAGPAPTSIPGLCTYPEPRPSASEVLWWFSVNQKLPSVATPEVRATVPAGGCSAAAFRDKRVEDALNFVIAMPNADQAATLAQNLGGATFASYQYVVELDSRLGSFEPEYESSLAAYVRFIEPPPTPSSTQVPAQNPRKVLTSRNAR